MDFREQLAKYKKENLIEELHTNDKINNKVGSKKIDLKNVKRGDVYWIDFDLGMKNPVGCEQRGGDNGMRLVTVVSNNTANIFSPVIIVVPLTSSQKTRIPTHVELIANEINGLSCDSIALCEQPKPIDKRYRLKSYAGHLDEMSIKRIDKALEISLDIGEGKGNKYTQKAKEYAEGIEEMDILLYNIVKFNNQDEGFYTSVRQERLQRIAELKSYCEKNYLNIKDFYGYSEDYKAIREDDKKIM